MEPEQADFLQKETKRTKIADWRFQIFTEEGERFKISGFRGEAPGLTQARMDKANRESL
jgi:hypothetical protein